MDGSLIPELIICYNRKAPYFSLNYSSGWHIWKRKCKLRKRHSLSWIIWRKKYCCVSTNSTCFVLCHSSVVNWRHSYNHCHLSGFVKLMGHSKRNYSLIWEFITDGQTSPPTDLHAPFLERPVQEKRGDKRTMMIMMVMTKLTITMTITMIMRWRWRWRWRW